MRIRGKRGGRTRRPGGQEDKKKRTSLAKVARLHRNGSPAPGLEKCRVGWVTLATPYNR